MDTIEHNPTPRWPLGRGSWWSHRPWLLRYGSMLVAVAIATALTLLFYQATEQVSLVLYVLAVMWSAWYGGLAPGLWATAWSVFVINFVFMPPPYLVDFNSSDLPRLILFLVVSVSISWLEESRRRAHALSRQRELEMERLSRLITMNELASGIAHELNQPLTAISIYGQTCLQDEATRAGMSPAVSEALQRIHAQAQRGGRILANYRRMLGKQPAQRSATDLRRVIAQALDLLQADLRRGGLRLETRLGEQAAFVVCDDVEIGQVLINLIKNAAEACGQESDARLISLRLSVQEHEAIVTVGNAGRPVSDEQLARAFEPFFSTKSNGLGMGLNISRSIIEAHGGRLTLRPRDGGGAIATVCLPCCGLPTTQPPGESSDDDIATPLAKPSAP